MPNATELANARTLPEETPSQPSRRGILGALGALAGVTLGVASTTALAEGVVSTAVAPPTDSIVGESPEFISIVERLGPLVLGHPDAIKEEEAARVRFAAEAPLPSKSSRRNIGVGGFDIVRKRATFDEKLEYMKKPGKLGMRVPIAIDDAYHKLVSNQIGTEEGDRYRKMAGISRPYERRLRAFAHEVGYNRAQNRRIAIENEMCEATEALLKHRPRTINGVRIAAATVAADPRIIWGRHPQMMTFLSSVMAFGEVPDQEEACS
jgi:hypothetical protein